MKNKKLMVLAGIMAMGATTVVPTFAQSAHGTEVAIDVTETAPAVISVTIPTTFSLAVVKDKTAGKEDIAPTVVLPTGTKIVNNGTTGVNVSVASISSSAASGQWGIEKDNTALATKEMALTIGGFTVKNNIIAGEHSVAVGTPLAIAASAEQKLDLAAEVGGANKDYTAEKSANAVHVEWIVDAQ